MKMKLLFLLFGLFLFIPHMVNAGCTLPASLCRSSSYEIVSMSCDGEEFTEVIHKVIEMEATGLDAGWCQHGFSRFSSLPSEIGQLTNLQFLRVSYKGLTSIPPEIGNLIHLKELYLPYNELTSLPSEIGNLINLERLVLGDDIYPDECCRPNMLSDLPPAIANLSQLKLLILSGNELTNLPSEIGELTNLQILSVYDNQLSSLPPEIGNLTKLEVLDLRGNRITSLPLEIGNLSNLTTLELRGNPLVFPPPNIIRQGTPVILEYLRNQAKEQAYQLRTTLISAGIGISILTVSIIVH